MARPLEYLTEAAIAPGDQRLDHRPVVALGAKINALGAQMFLQILKPLFSLSIDPTPLKWSMGLGDKGAAPQGQAQTRGRFLQSEHEGHGLLQIGLGFPRYARHAVELHGAQPPGLSVNGRLLNVVGFELFVDNLSDPLRPTFDRNGDRAGIVAGEGGGQLRGDRVGAHRGNAQTHVIELGTVEVVEQGGKLWMLGNRGPQQP